ncbi:MAG: hypothetical protein MZV63_27760 [Marinilabiliales bacterium]|nr:hypothetical protein [Marinilabiliales bacterium]
MPQVQDHSSTSRQRESACPSRRSSVRWQCSSVNPPRIAGRCSVFAKSDMIHHQQMATPLHDIVAGLCFALARNFRSTVARSKEIVETRHLLRWRSRKHWNGKGIQGGP